MSYGPASGISQPANASHSGLDYATVSVCKTGKRRYGFARGYISKDDSRGTLMVTDATIPAWSAAGRKWKGDITRVPAGQPDATDYASQFRLSAHQVHCGTFLVLKPVRYHPGLLQHPQHVPGTPLGLRVHQEDLNIIPDGPTSRTSASCRAGFSPGPQSGHSDPMQKAYPCQLTEANNRVAAVQQSESPRI